MELIIFVFAQTAIPSDAFSLITYLKLMSLPAPKYFFMSFIAKWQYILVIHFFLLLCLPLDHKVHEP